MLLVFILFYHVEILLLLRCIVFNVTICYPVQSTFSILYSFSA